MAYEVQAALIGAGSALLGGIVGTVGTLTAGRSQHERAMQAALKAEGRARAREAALALQDLVDVLARDIPEQHHASTKEDEATWVGRSNRVYANSERMTVLLLELPDPWRGRLSEGWRLLKWADEMCVRERAHHYQSCRSICYEVSWHMRRALSAFLRNEADLPGLTIRWLEYQEACKEAEDEKRSEYAQEIAEDEVARNKWLDARPSFKAMLAESPLPEYLTES